MEYQKCSFNFELFQEIIRGRKNCYKLFAYPEDNKWFVDYVGYDDKRKSYLFYHYLSKRYIGLIKEELSSIIYIAKIVPKVGSFVRRLYTDGSGKYPKIVMVTEDNLSIFKKYDDWEPVLNAKQQLKSLKVEDWDLVEFNDTDLYLYSNGYFIGRDKSFYTEELPDTYCIISVWSPAEAILKCGFKVFNDWNYSILSNLGYECMFNVNE